MSKSVVDLVGRAARTPWRCANDDHSPSSSAENQVSGRGDGRMACCRGRTATASFGCGVDRSTARFARRKTEEASAGEHAVLKRSGTSGFPHGSVTHLLFCRLTLTAGSVRVPPRAVGPYGPAVFRCCCADERASRAGHRCASTPRASLGDREIDGCLQIGDDGDPYPGTSHANPLHIALFASNASAIPLCHRPRENDRPRSVSARRRGSYSGTTRVPASAKLLAWAESNA